MPLLKRALQTRAWPWFAAGLSIAMLAVAHAFERFAFMGPCPLCLRQREVYWAVVAMAATGLVLSRLNRAPRFDFALNAMIGMVFAVGAIVAAYHAGVEWRWWPAPEGCAGVDADAIIGDLGLGDRQMVVSCLDAPWRMLGLSMAGWNALVSAGLAAASVVAALPGFSPAMRGPGPGRRRQAT